MIHKFNTHIKNTYVHYMCGYNSIVGCKPMSSIVNDRPCCSDEILFLDLAAIDNAISMRNRSMVRILDSLDTVGITNPIKLNQPYITPKVKLTALSQSELAKQLISN